ncbi:MAG: ABC transporter ATP-binding protein [Clostridiales bacterium]|jgi:ATP-binding cassette subfamily B protein|nr:ABC transporter ATP-binding protein [Clostridiales bacterium]
MGKLVRYLKPYWVYVLLAPLFMALEVYMDLQQPNYMADIVDKGIAARDMQFVMGKLFAMLGIAFIGMIGGIGCCYTSSVAAISFGTDVRSAMFKKIQTFSFSNLDRFQTSSLITRLTNDITQLENVINMSLGMMIRSPLLCIGSIVMTIRISPSLASVLLIAVPLTVLGTLLIIKKGFPLFRMVQTKIDRVNNIMRENLAGVRVVKAFVRKDFEENRFRVANEDLRDTSIKAGKIMSIGMPLLMLITNLATVAVLWMGGIKVQNSSLEIGNLIAFINYLIRIMFSLVMVAFSFTAFSRGKVSADRVLEVLNEEPDLTDPARPVHYDYKQEPQISRGEVIFDNVTFSYSPEGEPVLKNISFTARPGETVAILGETGSGKTTLVSLIPRLYDPQEGRVIIDGVDVRDYTLHNLRKGIGMVLQTSLLFSGTILDNLRWGDPEADLEKAAEAASIAQIHDFIAQTPDGYETDLSQGGVNLSGGQKQRMCIARALIKNPKILILDDSTSAVDMATELKIQNALRNRRNKCTTFIIAQRISSVMDADKIIVLQQGRIVGIGTHKELLDSTPLYRDIYNSQVGKELVLNA